MDEVVINDKYGCLLEPETIKQRIVLVTGGRNSGKSYTVSLCTIISAIEKKINCLYTRYTMTGAEKSVIPEMVEKIELLNALNDFHVTQTKIVNHFTKAKISFNGIKTSSGNQTANLKGFKDLDRWILDEAEEMTNEQEFDKLYYTIRSRENKNLIILILNPTTKEHWIYKRWFGEGDTKLVNIEGEDVEVSTHPEILHIHTTYLDNVQNIPADYLESIEQVKVKNPKKYKHVFLGGWLDAAEGAIFEHYEKIKEFPNNVPYVYGMDFGFKIDPTTIMKVGIDKKEKVIYIEEKFYKTGAGLDELEAFIKANIKDKQPIIADNAESIAINHLQSRGIKIYECEKQKVALNLNEILNYKICIVESSHNTIIEFVNYAWSNKRANEPIDKYNHAIDAIRYAFNELTAYRKKATFY